MAHVRTHYRRGHFTKNGHYVPPTIVEAHERRRPRVVEVAETQVRTHIRPAHLRSDGSFVPPTLVQSHARSAHRRAKPQR